MTQNAVLITWVDSYSTQGWVPEADFTAIASPCESLGWIINENADAIVIAGHKSVEDKEGIVIPQVNGAMTIPKCAIRSIQAVGLTASSCSPELDGVRSHRPNVGQQESV